jgi:hypothetical protein
MSAYKVRIRELESRFGLHVRLPALVFNNLLLRKLDRLFYLRLSDPSPSGSETLGRLALQLGEWDGSRKSLAPI